MWGRISTTTSSAHTELGEEVEGWIARCPVTRSRERLMKSGIATAAQLDNWQDEMQRKVNADIDRAREAPWPAVSTLFDFV